MAFNLGQTRLAGFKRLRAAVLAGDWDWAAAEALDTPRVHCTGAAAPAAAWEAAEAPAGAWARCASVVDVAALYAWFARSGLQTGRRIA